MSVYILINLAAISIPLLLSFDRKVHFFRRWRFLFPAIGINMLIFILWDIVFTRNGVWGFNPLYTADFRIFHLPPGEWLFFFTVPYSSVFLYDVFRAYLSQDPFRRISRAISFFLIGFLLVFALLHYDRVYTFITFLFLSLVLFVLEIILKVKFTGWFYFTYLFILFPFLIMNGILTGSFIEEEIVWYNYLENLDFRIFTIPVEDFFYGMLLILLNISLYEYFQKRKRLQKSES